MFHICVFICSQRYSFGHTQMKIKVKKKLYAIFIHEYNQHLVPHSDRAKKNIARASSNVKMNEKAYDTNCTVFIDYDCKKYI